MRLELLAGENFKEKVNEASMQGYWVLITLVDKYCQGEVTQELHNVARELCGDDDDDAVVKLLTIHYTGAIPNWPTERVPTLFAYHQGVKQQEIIASHRGEFPPKEMLIHHMQQWGVFYNEYDNVD